MCITEDHNDLPVDRLIIQCLNSFCSSSGFDCAVENAIPNLLLVLNYIWEKDIACQKHEQIEIGSNHLLGMGAGDSIIVLQQKSPVSFQLQCVTKIPNIGYVCIFYSFHV